MSRANVHDIKNNFGNALTPASTLFSGNISLAAPSAGRHLRIFKVIATGPVNLGNDVELEMRDGSSGSVLHTFGFGAKDAPELDLGSRFIQIDSGIHFTRPAGGQQDEVYVSVFYKEQQNLA